MHNHLDEQLEIRHQTIDGEVNPGPGMGTSEDLFNRGIVNEALKDGQPSNLEIRLDERLQNILSSPTCREFGPGTLHLPPPHFRRYTDRTFRLKNWAGPHATTQLNESS